MVPTTTPTPNTSVSNLSSRSWWIDSLPSQPTNIQLPNVTENDFFFYNAHPGKKRIRCRRRDRICTVKDIARFSIKNKKDSTAMSWARAVEYNRPPVGGRQRRRGATSLRQKVTPLVGRLGVHALPRSVELRVHLLPVLLREHLRVLQAIFPQRREKNPTSGGNVRLKVNQRATRVCKVCYVHVMT